MDSRGLTHSYIDFSNTRLTNPGRIIDGFITRVVLGDDASYVREIHVLADQPDPNGQERYVITFKCLCS